MTSARTAHIALLVVCFLAVVLLASITLASVKTAQPSTTIHPCALILNRSGQQECR